MRCVHCEKKIGWLKKPVEGSYCSELCRDGAREQADRRQHATAVLLEAELAAREAEQRALERERLEIEAAMLRGRSEVVLKPSCAQFPCPKCGAAWNQSPGAGALGRQLGECQHCGFRAEFIAIESCPNCRCHSLIIESPDDARCPRCKSRPRRRRQIA